VYKSGTAASSSHIVHTDCGMWSVAGRDGLERGARSERAPASRHRGRRQESMGRGGQRRATGLAPNERRVG
jgi:hypothetical protein